MSKTNHKLIFTAPTLLPPTLAEAKEFTEKGRKTTQGVRCPCCTQGVKEYSVRFNAGMAGLVVWMVRYSAALGNGLDEWIYVPVEAPRAVMASRKFDKVAAYGLIVTKENTDSKKRTSGIWRPTEKGVAFVRGEITIPSHAEWFDRECLGFTGKMVTIREVFASGGFDYEEAMNPKLHLSPKRALLKQKGLFE